MPGGDGFEGGLELGVGFGPIQLHRLDERSDATPSGVALVVTGEQRILSCKPYRPGKVLVGIAVYLDAPVDEEELEAVPVAGDVAELLAEAGFGRRSAATAGSGRERQAAASAASSWRPASTRRARLDSPKENSWRH